MEIDKILPILEQMGVMGVTYKKVMADGKVSMDDLGAAMDLFKNVGAMVDAFKDAGDAFEQMKDLDQVEGVEVIKKLYEIGKEIEKA